MPLTERIAHQVEVTEQDAVQVRTITIIERDGVEIARTNHRHVIMPGQDYAGETGKVRRAAAAAHVPTVVDRQVAGDARNDAISVRDQSTRDRDREDTPETEAAEAVAEQALLDAEAALQLAENAHEAFLISEDV